MHKIQIQAKKASQHTTGAAHHDNNSTNKTIGINKLGTLLSSQTTGANKYFGKPAFRFRFALFRFSLLRCF
jgi:hypothetical protein